MVDRLDVAGRLAEGMPAVERTQRYVRACGELGYRHPDLTSGPSQLRDRYGSEDGLDLVVLEQDCVQLRAAAAAVNEALRVQRDQVAELAAAWAGPGAAAAVDFVRRHCDAASTAAAEVRAAAQRCESLRDNLWHLIDVKVATVIAIDDRTAAQRPGWLAAADALATGAGDRQTVEEVIRQQVKPYVDNDIREEWVDTVHSTQSGVAACYDMVTDKMAATSPTYFEIPGTLGPGLGSVRSAGPPTAVMGPAATPAAVRPSPPLDFMPAVSTTPPAAPATPPAAPATPPVAPASASAANPTAPVSDPFGGLPDSALPMGAMGAGDLGGAGGVGGGLGGLANRILGALGGLAGSAGDQFSGLPELEDGFADGDRSDDPAADAIDDGDDADGKPDDRTHKPDKADADEHSPERAEPTGPVDAAAQGAPAAVPAPANIPAEPAPEVTPLNDGRPPIASPPPSGEGSTPCEIAADALPQAGQ